MFPTIGFLAHQILGIVGSQIETKRIFSLTCIFTNLRRYHLQFKNLENLIFVSKNWPTDLRDECKLPSNLVELKQTNFNFEKDLEKFEGSFEGDEIVNISNVEKKIKIFNFFGAILLFWNIQN